MSAAVADFKGWEHHFVCKQLAKTNDQTWDAKDGGGIMQWTNTYYRVLGCTPEKLYAIKLPKVIVRTWFDASTKRYVAFTRPDTTSKISGTPKTFVYNVDQLLEMSFNVGDEYKDSAEKGEFEFWETSVIPFQ